MSWEYNETNPSEEDMFRLYELYDEETDGIIYTEDEIEIIEKIEKRGVYD